MSVNLTTEEKTNLKNKFKILNNFTETFPKYHLSDSLLNSFSLKELLSDDFCQFYELILKSTNSTSMFSSYLHAINGIFYNAGGVSKAIKDSNEAKEVITRLVEISKKYFDKYYGDYALSLLSSIATADDGSSFLVKTLFESGFIKMFNKDSRNNYFDRFLLHGNLSDCDFVLQYIQDAFPEYENYPLILMNSTVDNETKIKVLKKSYRKKDFPRYKLSIRNNFKDWDILDIFIESVVLQNNRVKEKEDNIIKILGDIFCQPDHADPSVLNHRENFVKKYMPYFKNPDFIRKLFVEYVDSKEQETWSRKRHYEEFINIFYSEMPTSDLLDMISKAPSALKQYTNNLTSVLKNVYKKNESEELKKKIIKAIISNVNGNPSHLFDDLEDSEDNFSFMEIFEKYCTDEIFNPVFKYFVIDSFDGPLTNDGGRSWYLDTSPFSWESSISSSNKYLRNKFIDFVLLTPELLKKVKFFKRESKKAELGVNYEEIKENISKTRNNYNYYGMACLKTSTLNLNVYAESILRVKENLPEESIDILFNELLSIYLTDDGESALTSNSISIIGDKEFGRRSYYSSNTENSLDYIKIIFKSLSTLINILCENKKYSQYRDILTEKINYAKDSVELISGNNLL